MKKVYKVFLIIALVLMIVGGGIAGVTVAAAGFNWDKFTLTEENFTEYTTDFDAAESLAIGDLGKLSAWYEIYLVPSEDESIHVTYYAINGEGFKANVKGDTLMLMPQVEKGDFRRYIHFFDVRPMSMTIAIPAGVKNLDLRCEVGDVTCTDMTFDGDFTYTGDASSLILDRVKIGGTLHVESDTSSVAISETEAKAFNIDVDCGYIQFEHTTAQDMNIRSDLSDFEFTGIAIERSMRVYADCGNVRGTIDGAEEDFTITSSTDMGNTNLPQNSGSGAKRLDVYTDMGDINISFMR